MSGSSQNFQTPSPERPENILLIEDNLGDVKLFEHTAKKWNIHLKISHKVDGRQAIDFLLDQKNKEEVSDIDTIILDLNLPRMDGFDVLKIVKSTPHLKKIRVIVFTSSEAESDMKKARSLKADGFIYKGATLKDFRRNLLGIINS